MLTSTIPDSVCGPIPRTVAQVADDIATMAANLQETIRKAENGTPDVFGTPPTDADIIVQMERLGDFCSGWAKKFAE